uniref:Uncharacterized protein n=1 Tax=Arundo donax TaxID=35708 RepID=A0A0A9GDY5_ARUDO
MRLRAQEAAASTSRGNASESELVEEASLSDFTGKRGREALTRPPEVAAAAASDFRPGADLESERPHERLWPATSRIDLPRWWRRDQFQGMPHMLRESCDNCCSSSSPSSSSSWNMYLLPQTASWELELTESTAARSGGLLAVAVAARRPARRLKRRGGRRAGFGWGWGFSVSWSRSVFNALVVLAPALRREDLAG